MTLREIHERCKRRHRADPVRILNEKPACKGCLQWWPCPDRKDAEAALAILDESRMLATIEGHRAVLDPLEPAR